MKRTQLYETHVNLGARMVPFAGWEMPVQYDSPLEEHKTVREAAGLFDIDHMAQVIVEGPDALVFVQKMFSNDASQLEEWQSQYALLCYPDGSVVDDSFVYRTPEYYFVAINASNREKDVKWLQAHTHSFNVTITDISDETYMLALQGPKSQEILQTLTDVDLGAVQFHYSAQGKVAGIDCFLGSTGYTGEYGYELFFDASAAPKMWGAIMEAGDPQGIKPIGLAARDSLRFEPCMPLYGHELSATISPLEAGLGFAVKTDKPDFIGRDALLKQRLEGPPRRLACIEMVDKGVPREHYPVVIDGQDGFVTSGMYAPTVDAYVAMALIPRDTYELDKELEVMIRGKAKKAKIVKRPFYLPAYRR